MSHPSSTLGSIVACVRCRTPFHLQQELGGGQGRGSNECRKCCANTEKYGPPAACEHCGLLAAYTGTKCRRCFAAIVKWGSPVPCCRCARVCAFQRPDLSTGQTAASPLCFVCSLAKHRQTLITGTSYKHFGGGPGNKLRAAPAPHDVTQPSIDNRINHLNKPVLPSARIMDNYTRDNNQDNDDSPDNDDDDDDDEDTVTDEEDSDIPMDF